MSEMTNITTEASDSPVSNKTVTCANPLETRRCCVAFPLTFTNMRWWLCWGLPVQANPH